MCEGFCFSRSFPISPALDVGKRYESQRKKSVQWWVNNHLNLKTKMKKQPVLHWFKIHLAQPDATRPLTAPHFLKRCLPHKGCSFLKAFPRIVGGRWAWLGEINEIQLAIVQNFSDRACFSMHRCVSDTFGNLYGNSTPCWGIRGIPGDSGGFGGFPGDSGDTILNYWQTFKSYWKGYIIKYGVPGISKG